MVAVAVNRGIIVAGTVYCRYGQPCRGSVYIYFILNMKRYISVLARYWLKFGKAVHTVISALLLCAVYFLLITPFSLLFYTFVRKKAAGKDTAFTGREHIYTAEDMKYMD
jgi:hypothetical protein